MYRRILVAVDGSGTSQLALAQGIELAKEPQARLRLVHVVDELAVNIGPAYTPNDFWRAARKAGERVLEEAKARALKAGVEPETKLLEIRTLGALVRRVASSIVAEAERWEADLIVIGTHGRRGLSKLVLGSTADGVLRTAGRPVLLIPGTGLTARRARSRRA
jgi:nucleotide-binding universal stress UspA family protein